jgi:tetratricopeptide (TPR) repeat protein
VLVAISIVLAATAAPADDVVHLRPEPGEAAQSVSGEIADYTGDGLRMKLPSGVERTVPARRVERIESIYQPPHQQARAAMASHDFAQAVRLLLEANRQESRLWVRRMIIAELVQAYQQAGQVEQAGDAFLVLAESDPATPYFHTIPLGWTPGEDVAKAKAQQWLSRSDLPSALLLGASHLMSTDQRGEAVAALDRLSLLKDSHVALLAEAQLWRSRIATADEQTVDQWERRIDQMAEELRTGPYVTLAQALAHQKRWEQAAQAFLRAEILSTGQTRMAAEALVAAGEALMQLQRRDEAERVFRDAATRYARLDAGRQAAAWLERLQSQTAP